MTGDFTTGSIKKGLLRFALPYLLANFLQLFYGMVDLYVVGRYNSASASTAVSVGSQIMHMATVVIAGLAMGITVGVGRASGAKDEKEASAIAKTGLAFFAAFAVALTAVCVPLAPSVVTWMQTPIEAVAETTSYLRICFFGLLFIVAFNYIASLYRGFGDSKTPLFFVGVACVVNVALDFFFVGGLHLGAKGAAYATVIGQATSVLLGVIVLARGKLPIFLRSGKVYEKGKNLRHILAVGAPISLQDGLIQVSFLIITMIANARGLVDATAVGIVEKLIGFFFLVPSAFLSALSTVTAQNMGAGKPERARSALRLALLVCVSYGIGISVIVQLFPHAFVGLFTAEAAVLAAGCAYIRSYIFDAIFAGIHFCFSGYFSGDNKAIISFVHNITSIALVRIPVAYLTSVYWPNTLYPMGWAAPLGSILSSLICVFFYFYFKKKTTEMIK